MFDTLKCSAGVNINGEWEDDKGNPITDIADYLTSRYAVDPNNVNSFPYLGYFYKSAPKTPGGQSYNQSIPYLVHNDDAGRATLNKTVNWMKDKGYLKEFNPNSKESAELTEVSLGNL